MMKLFKLERIDGVSHDEAFGFVVRAENESSARIIVSLQCGDEGSSVWLDSSMTSCEELKKTGKSEVILRDYNAG